MKRRPDRGLLTQSHRYGETAAGSALTDWSLFTALDFLGVPPLPAQMVARIGGGVVSFLGGKYWSFPTDYPGPVGREVRRFLLLYAMSYALSLLLFALAVELLDYPPYPSKLFADASCFAFNFFMLRNYVYVSARTKSPSRFRGGREGWSPPVGPLP